MHIYTIVSLSGNSNNSTHSLQRLDERKCKLVMKSQCQLPDHASIKREREREGRQSQPRSKHNDPNQDLQYDEPVNNVDKAANWESSNRFESSCQVS